MAGKEIAVKKYVVRLDAEERDRLNDTCVEICGPPFMHIS